MKKAERKRVKAAGAKKAAKQRKKANCKPKPGPGRAKAATKAQKMKTEKEPPTNITGGLVVGADEKQQPVLSAAMEAGAVVKPERLPGAVPVLVKQEPGPADADADDKQEEPSMSAMLPVLAQCHAHAVEAVVKSEASTAGVPVKQEPEPDWMIAGAHGKQRSNLKLKRNSAATEDSEAPSAKRVKASA